MSPRGKEFTERVNVFFSKEQLESIKNDSAKQGMNVSSFIRKTVVERPNCKTVFDSTGYQMFFYREAKEISELAETTGMFRLLEQIHRLFTICTDEEILKMFGVSSFHELMKDISVNQILMWDKKGK